MQSFFFLFFFFEVFGLFDRIAQRWQETGREEVGGGDTQQSATVWAHSTNMHYFKREKHFAVQTCCFSTISSECKAWPEVKTDFQEQVTKLNSSFPLFNVFESNEFEKEQS